MIGRIFPMPVHTLLLCAMWLLLTEFTMGNLVMGMVLGILIPWISVPLSEPHPRVRRPILAIRYLFLVLHDIIVSNLQVAMLVLRSNRHLKPGFVAMPLDLTRELPLAVLATTIALTPGTVSVDLSEDRKWLYIHALDVEDPQELVDSLKNRYEKALREIFGC